MRDRLGNIFVVQKVNVSGRSIHLELLKPGCYYGKYKYSGFDRKLRKNKNNSSFPLDFSFNLYYNIIVD